MSIFTFSQIHSASVLSVAISLPLIESRCVRYSRMDFIVKTSGQMFSDMVQIQLNTSLFSQFTTIHRVHIIIANF